MVFHLQINKNQWALKESANKQTDYSIIEIYFNPNKSLNRTKTSGTRSRKDLWQKNDW